MTLPDQLKQATAATQAALEETPAAKALARGEFDRDGYANLLGQMGRLHASLETALAHKPDYATLYRPADMARAGAIGRDLAALDCEPPARLCDAVTNLIGLFRQWGEQSPWMLIGALYVVEGSRLPSLDSVRTVAEALGVEVRPGAGVDYHLDGIAARPMVWQQFKAILASVPFSEAQKENICRAATVTAQGLHGLYAAARLAEPVVA